jgi:hypothetical protein
MYEEIGWSQPGYHAIRVSLFQTLGYNFEPGLALISRKEEQVFLFFA